MVFELPEWDLGGQIARGRSQIPQGKMPQGQSQIPRGAAEWYLRLPEGHFAEWNLGSPEGNLARQIRHDMLRQRERYLRLTP